jgi:hypothetical protein
MKPEFSCGEEVSLNMDIMPIINSNCAFAQCHGSGRLPFLTSKQAVIDNANTIRVQVSGGSMPPGGALSDEEIRLIQCWVDDGALDN